MLVRLFCVSLVVLQGAEFEVASVRVHQPPLHTIAGYKASGPRVTLEGYNVALLVMEAYGLRGRWQIEFAEFPGRDDQLNVYYDIVAQASDGAGHSRDEFRTMLRGLLAERFQLAVHRGTKQMPVYALTVGARGPKFKESAGEGECSVNVGVVTGGQSYSFTRCGIEGVVSTMGNGLVDRPVIDQTGLTGKYDLRFVAAPANVRRGEELMDISPFSAVQDLGLKLQAQTAPMEIVVVDRFERPSGN